jgi:T-complex protein 1 subunit beta
MKAKVAAIAAHGINVFVNRQLVYNYPESLFAEAGIMCIEHADFEGVERRVYSFVLVTVRKHRN